MKNKKWIFIASSFVVITLATLKMIFPNEIGNIFYVALALYSALTYFFFFRQPTEKVVQPKNEV